MAGLKLTPASALRVDRHMIAAHGFMPNTSIQSRPLLIYHAAFAPSSVTPAAIEEHLNSVGAVVPQWRCTMYPTSHFHSPTHEVLAVSRLCFGGDDNPAKLEPTCPRRRRASVNGGHERGRRDGGELPAGCNWDMGYGNAGEQDKS